MDKKINPQIIIPGKTITHGVKTKPSTPRPSKPPSRNK